MDEFVGLGIVSDGGDDAVDVGMVLHLAAPGVEDGGDAELDRGGMPCRFSAAWGSNFCCAEVMKGLGGAFEEEVVEFFRTVKAQVSEFAWDGEGHHEVRDI